MLSGTPTEGFVRSSCSLQEALMMPPIGSYWPVMRSIMWIITLNNCIIHVLQCRYRRLFHHNVLRIVSIPLQGTGTAIGRAMERLESKERIVRRDGRIWKEDGRGRWTVWPQRS